MRPRAVLMSLLVLASWGGSVRGEAPEIERLEAGRARLAATRDSLSAVRLRIAAEAERLSVRVDSLKSAGRGSGSAALRDALRDSPGLAARLEALDRDLERVRAEMDGVRLRLAEAYDREIGATIGRLGRERDEALARRLRDLERAREMVGEEADVTLADPLEGLAIRPGDGPEEIRQKADMLEDGAARIRAEAAEMERRLRRLETENRLRGRAATLAREIGLFDEHLPEGRVVSSSQRTVPPPGPPTLGASSPEDVKGAAAAPGSDRSPVAETARAAEVVREGAVATAGEIPPEDLASEIGRLKARRKQAMERERILTDRAAALRTRLRRMLEERD